MFDIIFMLVVSLIILCVGGEIFVSAATALAFNLKISPLLISLTLVAFGTSLPELVVSIKAASQGNGDLVVGNIVGSNIANILFVLGVSGLIRPLRVDNEDIQNVRRDGFILALVSILFCIVAVIFGVITFPVALVMVIMIITYFLYIYFFSKQEGALEDERVKSSIIKYFILTICGLGAVLWGAKILIVSAIELAYLCNMSQAMVGASVVAFGTSIPELVICIIAVLRKNINVIIGGVIGSNLSNILLILGITNLIQPLYIPPSIINFDIWVMLGSSLLGIYMLSIRGYLSRLMACIFLSLYGIYIFYIF